MEVPAVQAQPASIVRHEHRAAESVQAQAVAPHVLGRAACGVEPALGHFPHAALVVGLQTRRPVHEVALRARDEHRAPAVLHGDARRPPVAHRVERVVADAPRVGVRRREHDLSSIQGVVEHVIGFVGVGARLAGAQVEVSLFPRGKIMHDQPRSAAAVRLVNGEGGTVPGHGEVPCLGRLVDRDLAGVDAQRFRGVHRAERLGAEPQIGQPDHQRAVLLLAEAVVVRLERHVVPERRAFAVDNRESRAVFRRQHYQRDVVDPTRLHHRAFDVAEHFVGFQRAASDARFRRDRRGSGFGDDARWRGRSRR